MGVIDNGGQRVTLSRSFDLGRDHGCDLRIDDRRVSGRHARLMWTETGWAVRDLGSRNGTWVDGRPLAAGRDRPLPEGARVRLASESVEWVLADAGPPSACARSFDGMVRSAGEAAIIALPSDEAPRVTIMATSDGSWVVERDGETTRALDQQRLDVDGVGWVLELPAAYAATRDAGQSAGFDPTEIELRFGVSRNEEHVQLTCEHPNGRTPVPARAHHYLLLTLARERHADAHTRGIAPADAGWMYVEQLCSLLAMSESRLNVDIFRARKQLAGLRLLHGGRIIERRRGTGQIRIGVSKLRLGPIPD